MKRALLFFLKVAVLIAVAVWLADRPGRVEIAWQGYIVETSVGILALAVGLLMLLAALTYWAWRGLRAVPGAFGRARAGSRRERGYRALTNGMVAVAAGDPEAAKRFARKADTLLDEPPLTMLLSAQAAQLDGDEGAAHRYFQAMLERKETEFLGLRGLLTEALLRQDRIKALDLARRAIALRPKTPWLLRTLFDLQVRLRKWSEAQATLAQAVKTGAIDQAAGRRAKTAILIERSREAEAAGNASAAMECGHGAVNLSPAFAPAVAREARLLARAGKTSQAARLIEKAWSRVPHRELAEAWRALGPENENPLDRVKRMERLHRLHSDDPESLIALGEAELEAKLWGAARSHLLRAEAAAPGRRVYRLLAELEAGEHDNPAAARDWLARAESAPPDPAWVCDSCGTVAPVWSALCGHCDSFDTLTWRAPTEAVHLPAIEAPQPVAVLPPVR